MVSPPSAPRRPAPAPYLLIPSATELPSTTNTSPSPCPGSGPPCPPLLTCPYPLCPHVTNQRSILTQFQRGLLCPLFNGLFHPHAHCSPVDRDVHFPTFTFHHNVHFHFHLISVMVAFIPTLPTHRDVHPPHDSLRSHLQLKFFSAAIPSLDFPFNFSSSPAIRGIPWNHTFISAIPATAVRMKAFRNELKEFTHPKASEQNEASGAVSRCKATGVQVRRARINSHCPNILSIQRPIWTHA